MLDKERVEVVAIIWFNNILLITININSTKCNYFIKLSKGRYSGTFNRSSTIGFKSICKILDFTKDIINKSPLPEQKLADYALKGTNDYL